MRVIAGEAKGRKLFAPKSHNIRPVLDKVKGAIFNILFDVSDLRVLDLFAGTGAVGIEALSRGASHATFVDSSFEAISILKKNLEHCKFTERSKIFPRPVPVAIEFYSKNSEQFDLIFVDPPYLKGLVNQTLNKIASSGILAKKGKVIVEHSPKEPIELSHQRTNEPIILTDTRKYGQTLVSFLCQKK